MEGKEPTLPTALPVAPKKVVGGRGSEGWDGTKDFFIRIIFGELF